MIFHLDWEGSISSGNVPLFCQVLKDQWQSVDLLICGPDVRIYGSFLQSVNIKIDTILSILNVNHRTIYCFSLHVDNVSFLDTNSACSIVIQNVIFIISMFNDVLNYFLFCYLCFIIIRLPYFYFFLIINHWLPCVCCIN